MATPKKGKGTRGGSTARTGGGAAGRQEEAAGASGAGEAGSMQSEAGSMGGAGSRQSAGPEAELPIQSGGERIGVGHHRQGRQTGGLHQPSIADELAAESAPDQGSVSREGKRKP